MLQEPAASIIAKFGRPVEVAKALGTSRSTVGRWVKSVDEGGTGGIIPHWHHAKLLAAAKDRGIALSASDFVPNMGTAEGKAA